MTITAEQLQQMIDEQLDVIIAQAQALRLRLDRDTTRQAAAALLLTNVQTLVAWEHSR